MKNISRIMKNMEHEFLYFKARTNNWKWKTKSGLSLTIIGWCQFITCTKKFKVPDQLLTTVKLRLICNYPHYPSVLSRKLESDPTTLIEIAVYSQGMQLQEPQISDWLRISPKLIPLTLCFWQKDPSFRKNSLCSLIWPWWYDFNRIY